MGAVNEDARGRMFVAPNWLRCPDCGEQIDTKAWSYHACKKKKPKLVN